MLNPQKEKKFKKFMKSLKRKFLEYEEIHLMEPEYPDDISLYDLALMNNWFDKVMLVGLVELKEGIEDE